MSLMLDQTTTLLSNSLPVSNADRSLERGVGAMARVRASPADWPLDGQLLPEQTAPLALDWASSKQHREVCLQYLAVFWFAVTTSISWVSIVLITLKLKV